MEILKEEKNTKKHKNLIIFIVFLMFLFSFLLISCGRKEVPVESISLSKTETALFLGQRQKLHVDFQPDDAYGFSIVWSSTAPKTVSVDSSGHIRGLKYGTAIITASVKNTDIKATCNVLVNDGSICMIDVDNNLDIYYEGQTFNVDDLKVYAVYESGVRKLLPAGSYTVEAPEFLTVGSQIKITYGVLPPEIITPLVREDYVNGISITTPPTKTNYIIGEEFDKTGMEVTLSYASGKSEISTNYTIDTTKVEFKQTEVKVSYSDEIFVTTPITTRAEINVSSIEALQNAINAGYKSIMIEEGVYNTRTPITISSTQDLLIFGQKANTSINGYDIIPLKIEGNCTNITIVDLTLTCQGDTPQTSEIDLSACTGGNITLSNIVYTSILQPNEPQYTLKIN